MTCPTRRSHARLSTTIEAGPRTTLSRCVCPRRVSSYPPDVESAPSRNSGTVGDRPTTTCPRLRVDQGQNLLGQEPEPTGLIRPHLRDVDLVETGVEVLLNPLRDRLGVRPAWDLVGNLLG